MNYLHSSNNFDWTGAHSHRACAGMTFIHEISNLEGKHMEMRITNQIKNLVKEHKNRKVSWWKPKLGKLKISKNVFDLNDYGFATIDGRQIAFDSSFMYWIISEYNFDWYDIHQSYIDLAYNCFKAVHDDIVKNYEFYCTSEKSEIRLERLLCLFLSAKTGMAFTDGNIKSYDDVPKFQYKLKGNYNEPYLLAEQLINEVNGTDYQFAQIQFGEHYNKKLQKIDSDTCKAIVKAINTW